MAVKVIVKMIWVISLLILFANVSFSLAIIGKEEKCSCFNLCTKNFTSNSIEDIQKISACQRGCRLYTLVLHSSHESNHEKSLKNSKEGCLLSCSEGYLKPSELSACNFGCSAVDLSKVLCNTVEIMTPQITYSFLIEESDVLIQPGEPEPDDALTDPSLRKQIQKTLISFLDSSPQIPEIRFKNMPMKTEHSHSNFKCPKFYGLDSKFEFRNGKIIIGDLYLFIGVFIFVVLCFLLGHHIETNNIKRQMLESRLLQTNTEELLDKEPLLSVECEVIENENLPEKMEIPGPEENEEESKFSCFTLIFQGEDSEKEEPIGDPYDL